MSVELVIVGGGGRESVRGGIVGGLCWRRAVVGWDLYAPLFEQRVYGIHDLFLSCS